MHVHCLDVHHLEVHDLGVHDLGTNLTFFALRTSATSCFACFFLDFAATTARLDFAVARLVDDRML